MPSVWAGCPCPSRDGPTSGSPSPRSTPRSRAVVTLIDTADAYHLGGHDEVGHNEELIARAVREFHGDTSDVLIATKGGHLRPEAGNWAQNGAPGVPEGGGEGLGEAARRRARSACTSSTAPTRPCRTPTRSGRSPSCSTRASSGWRASRTPTRTRSARRTRCSTDAWRPCRTSTRRSSGRASRSSSSATSSASRSCRGARSAASRSAADLGTAFEDFAYIARDRGVTPQVIALAWELQKSDVVIPIPGASRPQSILNSLTAPTVRLRPEDVARLDASQPAAV